MPPKLSTVIENRVVRASAFITATVALTAMVWTATDYTGIRPIMKREFTDLVIKEGQLELGLALLEYQILIEKAKHEPLTTEEQRTLCLLAHQLGFTQIGCLP